MATVNPDALNVLTLEQAENARRIIDDIGHISNELGPTSAAAKLDAARSELKSLFAAINDHRYPVIQ